MGAKTVVGSGPYSNVKDVHTLREKLSGTNFPFVPGQETSCSAENRSSSAVAFLCLLTNCLVSPCRMWLWVGECGGSQRGPQMCSSKGPKQPQNPSRSRTQSLICHLSPPGKARATCVSLPLLGLCSMKLINTHGCQLALKCSKLSLPSHL